MLARPWSAVVRVPTVDGLAWFKENPTPTRFEPALTVALARRRPDCVPEVIAAEGARLLTRGGGDRLRDVYSGTGPAPDWEEVVALHAETQIDFMIDVDEALALGTPDRRPDALAALAAELPGWRGVTELLVRIAERVDNVIPLTVVHEEMTDRNVIARGERVRLIDWAEASVTHPFVGALMPLRVQNGRGGFEPGSPEVERLRDVYLEPFTRFAAPDELRRTFESVYLLTPAVRALGWHAILSPIDPAAAAEVGDVIGAWLEVFHAIHDGTISLGDA